MSDNTIIPGKDIRIAERTRTSNGDAVAPPATPEPPTPQRIEFKRFPNGMVLGWQENPRKPGSFVVHDATGTPYAVVLHSGVADLICQAVTFLFHERDKAIAKQAAEFEKLENAVELPSSEQLAPFAVLPSPEIPKV